MLLSTRAHSLSKPSPSYLHWSILQELRSPSSPNGFISLGVAENTLMHDILSSHIHANLALPNEGFTYGDGGKRIKSAIARFLTRRLEPVRPVLEEHVARTNGCSSAIEHLAWALGNPGDTFLLGRPYYGSFVGDVTQRMGTELTAVSFGGGDPFGLDAVTRYEDAILGAQAEGRRVAGLIVSNPHNPLGRCYPKAVLIALLRLCEKYKMHFISDEVYALSTFTNTVDAEESTAFESILSIDTSGVIDPALVHVVWGISKDFGANGLRLGAIISQHNPALHAALVPVALYSSASSLVEHVAANILEDDAWVDAYVKENQKRLAENYFDITTWAKKHDIEYAPGVNAAFFLWVDLGAAYRRLHPGAEIGDDKVDDVVMDSLLRHKIFLASGVRFGTEKPGWFRIVFSQKQEYLDDGLDRVIEALQDL